MVRSFGWLFLAATLLPGCVFLDASRQQEKLDAMCLISGTAATARKSGAPIVVVLFRRDDKGEASGHPWQVADHFVLEQPGRWVFGAGEGRYAVAAFEDRSRDLVYQPGESYAVFGAEHPIGCGIGTRVADVSIDIPEKVARPFPRSLDIPKLQARGTDAQLQRTMGQLTAVGELAKLSDPQFSRANAENGLWRPYDFLTVTRPGVYFLEAYDARKIPVLFVHGINGTPIEFEYLVGQLDRSRFQPWVYYYPSGAHIAAVADHLEQTMSKLQLRYGFPRFAVVAHSMGGLVSRGFVQRHAVGPQAASIPLLVTISTPWGGHKGAQLGVDTAPVVVRVWEDMAPGSAYQRSLYSTPLPAATKHHLVFTYNRKSASFGESDDQVVTVASQLLPQAQRDAVRLYGFDENHTSVLRNPQLALLVNQLLAGAFERTSP